MTDALIVRIGEHAFALGAVNAWRQDEVPKLNEGLRRVKLAKQHGYYLLDEDATNKRVYSLAAALAQLDEEALYCVGDADSPLAWLCEITGHTVRGDSDTCYDMATEVGQQRCSAALKDARQLIGDGPVYPFSDVEALTAFVEAHLDALDLSVCVLRAPGKGWGRDAALGVATVVLLGLLAWWYWPDEPLSIDYLADDRRNLTAYLDAYAQQLTPPAMAPYVAQALSLPHQHRGFVLSSVSCGTGTCLTTYSHAGAPEISPALHWARTIDDGAYFAPETGTLLVSREIPIEPDEETTMASVDAVLLRFADLGAMLALVNIAVPLMQPTLAPGAQALGEPIWGGQWQVTQVPLGLIPAVIEGLGAIPGIRLAQFNVAGETASFGGEYVFRATE